MKNETEKMTASAIASESIRQFRLIEVKSEISLLTLSGRTGKPVEITTRNLNNYEKNILCKTFDFIDGKLKGTIYREPVNILMESTAFVATSGKHIVAHSCRVSGAPLVILNAKTITGRDDEFAVTILHELLHFLTELEDKHPNSLEEARHDFACYDLLDIPIPHNHWAFTKYPQLKGELRKD